MATFRYRAATASGQLKTGVLESTSRSDALDRIKRLGLMPIEAVEATGRAKGPGIVRTNSSIRQGIINGLGELSVLLNAGLSLDRALAVCVENMQKPALKSIFEKMRDRVRSGNSLSRAMAESGGAFPPMASAMAEAGEASGKLDDSISRLAEALDRAEALRQTVVSALVYPAMLLVIATGVILVMLLFVVPQFEDVFSDAGGKLPFMTQLLIDASHALKSYGLLALLVLVVCVIVGARWVRQPGVRSELDKRILRAPMVGNIIRDAETARFARTLGSLIDGGVALPTALSISRKSLINTHMASAIDKVSRGLKQGGGLTGPLAATKLFPPMAMSFLRTGEETAQLGRMLTRLADVLDREVRQSIQRVITILTPAITIFMALLVGGMIASIMTAILGFNDQVLGP